MGNKLTKGVGGRGTKMEISSQRHPESHFQTREVRVKQADDGSFVMEHHQSLKPEHEHSEGFYGGYRDAKVHTAKTHEEMASHVASHFGGGSKKKGK